MTIIKTKVLDLFILEPKVFGDHRGWFMESWTQRVLDDAGLEYKFVQDNHSYSAKKGVLRGLHFQRGDDAQAKVIRCMRGSVLDVAVDLRKGSPTYMMWEAVELSAGNKRQLIIPRGFAHGFLTLSDDVEVLYKADNYYVPSSEGSVCWNDPDIGIDWGISDPILSDKDRDAPLFLDCNADFVYEAKK